MKTFDSLGCERGQIWMFIVWSQRLPLATGVPASQSSTWPARLLLHLTSNALFPWVRIFLRFARDYVKYYVAEFFRIEGGFAPWCCNIFFCKQNFCKGSSWSSQVVSQQHIYRFTCFIFSLQDVCVVALHPSWCVIRYVQSQKYTTNTIKQIFLPNGAGLLITSVIEALVCCLSHPPIIHAATSAVIVGHHAFSGHLHCLDGQQWQSL